MLAFDKSSSTLLLPAATSVSSGSSAQPAQILPATDSVSSASSARPSQQALHSREVGSPMGQGDEHTPWSHHSQSSYASATSTAAAVAPDASADDVRLTWGAALESGVNGQGFANPSLSAQSTANSLPGFSQGADSSRLHTVSDQTADRRLFAEVCAPLLNVPNCL